MNSEIIDGKRTWVSTGETERILDTFDFLKGYTDEIDNLIVESMQEIGFQLCEFTIMLHYHVEINLDANDPFMYVVKKDRKWFARVEGGGVCVEEPIL